MIELSALYYRPEFSRHVFLDLDTTNRLLASEGLPTFSRENLARTHQTVISGIRLPTDSLEEAMERVFRQMQAEVWSPDGERAPLIEGLGLTHTSMSVGDAILDHRTDDVYFAERIGFRRGR